MHVHHVVGAYRRNGIAHAQGYSARGPCMGSSWPLTSTRYCSGPLPIQSASRLLPSAILSPNPSRRAVSSHAFNMPSASPQTRDMPVCSAVSRPCSTIP